MPCICFLQTGYSSTHFSKFLHILKWKYDGSTYLTIYQVTTSATSGAMSGNKWQRVEQRVTMSDDEWQRVAINDDE